jgi:hypothetical protein
MQNPNETVTYTPRPYPSTLTSDWKKYIIQAATPNDTRLDFSMSQKALIPRVDLTSYEFPVYNKPNTNGLTDVDLAFMQIKSPNFPIWVEKIKVCLHQYTTYGCLKLNVWDFGNSANNIPVNLVGLNPPSFNQYYNNDLNVKVEDISYGPNSGPPYDIVIFTITDESEDTYYSETPALDASRKAIFEDDLADYKAKVDSLATLGVRTIIVPLHPPHIPTPPNDPKEFISRPDFEGDDTYIYSEGTWETPMQDGTPIDRPPTYNDLIEIYETVTGGVHPSYVLLTVDNSSSMVPADIEPALTPFKNYLNANVTNYSYLEPATEDWLRIGRTYLDTLNETTLENEVKAKILSEIPNELYDARWKPLPPSCEASCSITFETEERGEVTVSGVKAITENIPTTIFPNYKLISNVHSLTDLYMTETEQVCKFTPFDYVIQANSILRFALQYAEGNAYGLKVFIVGWGLECDKVG